jgi:hypothetical protein
MSYSNGTTLSYQGDVKFTIKQGQTVLETRHYKNSGALPLFRFIGECLVGNFNSAGRKRPFKIKLLIDQSAKPTPDVGQEDVMPEYVAASNFITLAAAPEIQVFGTQLNGYCQAKFSYIFPISQVFESGANTIAIYGVDEMLTTEFCAYHKLTKTADNDEPIWDPIILKEEDYENNKIFTLEWTMTIANKLTTKGASK